MSDQLSYGPDIERSTQDWESILRRGYESKELDYKGPCTWDEGDKKACCELVKDILAIANTKGGFIVLGVRETSPNLSWDGLTADQCDSFETSRLNRFVQNYTDPPINAHVIKHTSQGSHFVIVEIPRFSDTPHICQKDYLGVLEAARIYVRTDNNESAPIKDSADMRAIVERAVRNRGDQLLTSFRAILTGTAQTVYGPTDLEHFDTQVREATTRSTQLIPKDIATLGFRETVFHPGSFERLRFTVPYLESMAEAACVTYGGWPYIFYTQKRADCIFHLDDGLEMVLSQGGTFQYWRLHQSGCLYVCEMFQEDQHIESRSENVLGTNTLADTCAKAVRCLVDLFTERLADDESVRLHMRLRGVRGRTLAMIRGNSYSKTPYNGETDQIVYDEQRTFADWRAGVIPHAIELLRHVIRKFNANAPLPSDNEVAPLMQKLLSKQL